MSAKVDWSVLDKVSASLKLLRRTLDRLETANEESKRVVEKIQRSIKRK